MTQKIRIHQLAKELDMDYKKIIAEAKELGIEAKSHASSVTEEEADLIRESFKEQDSSKTVKADKKTKIESSKEQDSSKTAKADKKTKMESSKEQDSSKTAKADKKTEVIPDKPAVEAIEKIATKSPVKKEKSVKKETVRPKVKIHSNMTTSDLAKELNMDKLQLIEKYAEMNILITENQRIHIKTAEKVLDNFNYSVEVLEFDDAGTVERKNKKLRAPVVTIMGHVDHGKTQLLDTIRNTNVIARESGGITQHIGACKVDMPGKGTIVFIDTPGHEAFTAMRARGSQITDIVVLVVAGDDGVMPQTIEAINHAKAAGVPIIVAVNKMDLPEYDSEQVLTQLSHHDILTEKWGGDVISIEISAKKNQNVDELLEMIILQAEMMELKAYSDGPAEGIIIESELDKQIGPTGTVLISNGVLDVGNSFVCGVVSGKVKAMTDDRGQRLKSADSSTPVKILGFENIPVTGDILNVVNDKTAARDIAENRKLQIQKGESLQTEKVSLEDLQRQLLGQENKELNLILKCDVSGSLEAIKDAFSKLQIEEVKLNLIHNGVGTVTKRDIMLASASNAVVIGFNISASSSIKKEAESEGVQIKTYRIIYEIIDDIKKALEGMLSPEETEVTLGQAEIKKTYNISGVGTIAGCSVTNGMIMRKAQIRVLRDSKIVYVGNLAALKRFKNDVSEVNQGYECGIHVEGFNDIKIGDIIESFQLEQRSRSIEEAQ